MKKLLPVLMLMLISVSIYAQRPCAWFSDPTPDSLTLDSARLTIDIPKLRTDQNPSIDGIIDDYMFEFGFDTLKREYIVDSDQDIVVMAAVCHDLEWFYLTVVSVGDDSLDVDGDPQAADLVQLSIQSEFGGKGTQADHYDNHDWRKWYWMKDGDKKFVMPIDPDENVLTWLDTDANDNGTSTCAETEMADWLSLEVLDLVYYEVAIHGDSVIYEMAFNLVNFFEIAAPDTGYAFGFEVSYKDYDNSVKRAQINWNDIGNNAYAYAPACAKFVLTGDTLEHCLSCGTEIVENYTDVTVKLYPNPAIDVVKITNSEKISVLSLYNISGQEILKQEHPGASINISGLESGTYIINLNYMNGNSEKRKLTVQ